MSDHESPYWTVLPRALVRRSGIRVRGNLLRDVLWGQFCLFLFVRIQDDLFDGQASDRRLLYAADQFLIEAERAFERQFARSCRFWSVFHGALESTTRAILRIDRLQCQPEGRCGDLAAGYAEIAAIFKVGTAAICLKLRQPADLASLAQFADEVAIGGQIIDDLEDVHEDLGRNRYNYVAKRLLGGRSTTPEEAARHITREIVLGDGASRILGDVQRHLERAAMVLESVDCPPARSQVDQAFRDLVRLKRALHRRSVQRVFHPLLSGQRLLRRPVHA
ncbi:MAG TPA: hypothetical protein VMT87_12885 [Vicinamibacteria bacterium]|nr:hypothetical protein [Vicinamibacteria bacterium]